MLLIAASVVPPGELTFWRKTSGVSPDYVRLSLGIEDWPDLEADLSQALDAAT